MKNKYKYSVVTTLFGDYEKVKEVENPQEDVEYVLVTDNPNLTSNTWTIKIFNDYDKIPYKEVAWIYIKFFTFNYCNSNICLYKDGSIQIKDDFSKLIEYFINHNYEYAITNEQTYFSINQMINYWATKNFYGYNKETADKVLNFYKNKNYNVYEFGVCNTSFILKQNTEFTKQIDETVWNTMCNYNAGPMGFRINQDAVTFVLNKYAYHSDKLLILDNNILWSPWFDWCFHKATFSKSSDVHTNKTVYKNLNYKFALNNNIVKPLTYSDINCKKDPLLTIVLFATNLQKTRKTISSMHNMTYSNWECILVTNNNEIASEQFEEKFTIICQNDIDYNAGLIGNGKYLIHIKDGSLLDKYFCECAIKEMEKNKNVCISTGPIKTNEDVILTDSVNYNTLSYNDKIKSLLFSNVFNLECIIRAETFKKINGFKNTNDVNDLFIRYFYNSKNENIVYYIYEYYNIILDENINIDTFSQYSNMDLKLLYSKNKEIYKKFLNEQEIDKIIKL